MKYILSRFGHDIEWVKEYTEDCVLYDRSPELITGSPEMLVIPVKNLGSDISDKFRYIIENYNNLPDIAVYAKANLFKYITKEEFDRVKDNVVFTPLLTKNHIVYEPTCRYNEKGMYEEINNYFYLESHQCRNKESFEELVKLLGMDKRKYNVFAPGSNYILTREDIHRHSIEFYIKLRSFLDWTIYPGEAQILERNLYYLWGTDTINGI